MRTASTAAAAGLWLFGGIVSIHAQDPLPVPREVLALSSSVQDDCALGDDVHDLLQMPLEHVGLRVRQWDLSWPQPPDLDAAVTRGVLTFFDGDEAAPPWLWPWLRRQRERIPGLRFVHFGELGPLLDDPVALAAWLRGFGLEWTPTYTDDPRRVEVDLGDPARTCFESRPVYRMVHHGPRPAPDAEGLDVWVTTRDREAPGGDARTPVVVGRFGAVAMSPWTLHQGTGIGDRRWYLDPFRFFADAFATRGLPRPDPCVAFGRRVFLLHVDGDGFESTSTVAHGELSARVFLDRVIDRFRIPMTVSVIVAGVTDRLQPPQPTAAMRLAREVLARPWVEPASHSVLHPLNWRRRLTPRSLPRTVTWYPALDGFRHDMVAEVRESVAFLDRHLSPPGRPCRVMLWSGLCNPTAEVVAEAERLGCANLNGGTFRVDAETDSIGYVLPWGRWVGGVVQAYCGAANENLFTGFYTTAPASFGHIDATIARTGAPRVLKPANVYVHFYSAERPPRLRQLERLVQRWAYDEATVPLPASAYARAVQSALDERLRIGRVADGFALRGLGALRTVRFDDPPGDVDWRRSEGVVGANRIGGALYLQLAGDAATVRFCAVGSAAPHPHVVEADCALSDIAASEEGVRFRASAHRPRTVVLGGFAPEGEVRVRCGEVELRLPTDADGRCRLALESPGDVEVEVRAR